MAVDKNRYPKADSKNTTKGPITDNSICKQNSVTF